MAFTIVSAGVHSSNASSVGVVASILDSGVFIVQVDTGNMAIGDEVTLEVQTKVLSTAVSTTRAFSQTFAHNQADPIKHSIPIPSAHQLRFTMQQTSYASGVSAVQYPFSVLKL